VRATFLVGVVLAIGSGCGGGECLEGTVRYQDTCVPFDPFDRTPPVITVDPPVRTRSVGNIRLVANEPAEIYVTTDDSEVTLDSQHERDEIVIPNDSNDIVLRYFAVDLAGNQTTEQIVLWNIDQLGPAPPGRFKLTLSNGQRDLSWLPPQNESHLGGVLVARVDGRVTTQPTSGLAYEVGQEIEPGVTVVAVTGADPAAASFSENLTPQPGIVRYIAWAFDDLLNYGPPAGDFDLVPLPQQRGQLAISTVNGSVAPLGAPPPNVELSGTATITGPAGCATACTVSAKLTLRNKTTRVLHAPKLVMRTNNLNFAADGVFDSDPYKAYGAAINPGASTSVTWDFTGVIGNSLQIDLELKDNQIVMQGNVSRTDAGSVNDFETGGQVKLLAAGPGDANGGFGAIAGGFTPDGRVVFGSRSSGTISSWDLQTGSRLATTELRAQRSHVPQVVLDRSGSIGYALVCEDHLRKLRNSGGVETELVRFDVATLSVQGRIPIGISRNRDMRISPDARLLIIATGTTGQGVLVVDLETFTVTQKLLTGNRPETAVFTPDAAGIAAVGNDITLFDLASGMELDTIALPAGGGRTFRASFNGASELWVGRQSNMVKVDLTKVVAPIVFNTGTRVLEVFDGKVYGGFGDLRRFDTNGNEEAQFFFNNQRGHWLGRSPF
jgi:hypothetical protein